MAAMISLIVPIYNMSQYLDRFMETIRNQTVSQFEVVLVDDGSTDKSGDICDFYSQEGTPIIRTIHKKNGGLSSARNAGIDVATGDFVIFPDPDDWLEPNYVERFQFFQQQYEADMVCLGFYTDYSDRAIKENENISCLLMNREEAQKALIIAPKIKGFVWNKLYRRDIIQKKQLRFENNVGTTEDLDFTYRYLQYSSKIFFDPSTYVYHYFQRAGAATHSTFNMRKIDSIHTFEKIIENTGIDELKDAAESEICNTALNLLWEYLIGNQHNKNTEKIIREYICKYKTPFLLKNYYGWGRKVQCCVALISPKIFCFIKNRISREQV